MKPRPGIANRVRRFSLARTLALFQGACQRLQASAILRGLILGCSRRFAFTTKPALIIAPHQDDETLGCGGLIALKRQRGADVQIVFLTDGTKAPLLQEGMTSEVLKALRHHEALEAAGLLGVSEESVHFFDLPDGSLEALPDAARREFVERLRALMSQHRSEEIFVTHRRDCHPDHEAAYRLVREATLGLGFSVELFEYAIWMTWSAPLFFRLKLSQLAGARRLEIRAALAQKLEAIKVYRSQCATLPGGFLARFRIPYEVYFQATDSY